MNFEALVTRVKTEISNNRDDLDTLVSNSGNTIIEDAINDAVKAVSLWYPQQFDEVVFTTTTTAGQKVYKLPSNLVDLESVRHAGTSSDDEGSDIAFIHANEWDTVLPKPERWTQGKPSLYTRHGKNIELFRIPDDTYTLYLRAIIAPGDLTNAEDVPRVDEWWHRAIVVQALYYILAGPLREEERALIFKTEADEWKALMMSRERRDPDSYVKARPFTTARKRITDYWKDPFVDRIK